MHGKVDLGCSRMYDSGAQIVAQKNTKKRMAQACPMPNLGPSVLEVWLWLKHFNSKWINCACGGHFFKRSIVIKEFSGDSSHVPSAEWSSGPVPGKGPKGKSCQPHLLLVICQPLFHGYPSCLRLLFRFEVARAMHY